MRKLEVGNQQVHDIETWQGPERRKGEQWHQALAANLPGGAVFIVDQNLRYLLANGEALYAAGQKPSDFEGRTLFDVLEPEYATAYERYIRQALSGESFFHEHSIHGRSFHSRGAPLRDDSGHIYAVLVVSYDITERLQTEEALRQSAEQTRLADAQIARILESVSDAFYAVDSNFCFTYVNRKAEEWWGRNREYLIGRHYWTEFPGAVGSESYQHHLQVMRDRQPFQYETVSPLLNRWIDVTIYPATDGGLAVYFRDITDRKKSEEVLLQINQQLEARVGERTRELSAALSSLETALTDRQDLLRRIISTQEQERRRLSHELHDQTGQHLTGLALGLKALEETIRLQSPPDPETEAQFLRLRGVAEELAQDIHRIAVELRPTALDDLGLLPALANHVARWSEISGIPAEFDSFGIPGGQSEQNAERGQRLPEIVETTVYRVVQEALTNIARCGSDGQNPASRVSVTLQRFGRHLLAAVEDDGPGFDVEAARQSGRLGIVGMRERAASCGGTLEIESAPGKGTTVYLRIPLMAALPVDSDSGSPVSPAA